MEPIGVEWAAERTGRCQFVFLLRALARAFGTNFTFLEIENHGCPRSILSFCYRIRQIRRTVFVEVLSWLYMATCYRMHLISQITILKQCSTTVTGTCARTIIMTCHALFAFSLHRVNLRTSSILRGVETLSLEVLLHITFTCGDTPGLGDTSCPGPHSRVCSQCVSKFRLCLRFSRSKGWASLFCTSISIYLFVQWVCLWSSDDKWEIESRRKAFMQKNLVESLKAASAVGMDTSSKWTNAMDYEWK